MKKRVLVPIVLNLFLGICLFFLDVSPASAAVPSGFEDRLVTDIQQPTAMAFLPDGRMLVTTQPGFLQTYDPATGNKQAVLDIRDRICSNSERGLLSVAVDPKFQTNRYIYLYYTKKIGTTCDASSDDINRVSRFSLDGTAVSGEKVLIDKIPSPGGNHNGGICISAKMDISTSALAMAAKTTGVTPGEAERTTLRATDTSCSAKYCA